MSTKKETSLNKTGKQEKLKLFLFYMGFVLGDMNLKQKLLISFIKK